MTVGELYTAVALLGFENDIDEESTFYPALNTALHDILRVVPYKKQAVIAHYPPVPLVVDSDILHVGGKVLSYSAEGAKSYYIEVSGTGTLTVNGIPYSWEDERGYKVYKGFCKDAVTNISFAGDYDYRIRHIALYDSLSSAREADIVSPSKHVVYDLEEILDDFLRVCETPKMHNADGEDEEFPDFHIRGGLIRLPRAYPCDAVITYLPTVPNYTKADEELAIRSDCIGALKLLIASYVWLDDNASRAQYYKSLYNEEIALIVSKDKDPNVIKYKTVDNWA